MIKNIVVIFTAFVVIFIACEGPMGPQGINLIIGAEGQFTPDKLVGDPIYGFWLIRLDPVRDLKMIQLEIRSNDADDWRPLERYINYTYNEKYVKVYYSSTYNNCYYRILMIL